MEIIIGKNSGFCRGVEKAVIEAEEKLEKSKETIYCLGELVHNTQVVNKLKKKGLIIVNTIDEAKGKVIIRAHGIPKKIYKQAQERKLELIDCTCTKVKEIHKISEKYVKEGYYIFLIGIKKHPETIGTAGFCEGKVSVIEKIEEIEKAEEKFDKSKRNKILIISQTTFHLKKFEEIVTQIKEKIKIPIEIKNTICNTTQVRQKETEELAKQVEYMIVIGGKNSSNTTKLYEIANQNCKNVIMVEKKEELNIQKIKQYQKIGIVAGASTAKESIKEIYNSIK